MFEDFRKQSDEDTNFENDDDMDSGITISQGRTEFLGMTALQRFIIACMLLLMTCILGAFFLLVTGRIVLPFMS